MYHLHNFIKITNEKKKKRKKENFNLILAFDKSIFNLHSTLHQNIY